MSDQMNPGKIRELLPWYLNGTLPEEDREAVEAYLRHNPEEVQALDGLRMVRDAVRARPSARPSPDVPQAVLKRVRSPGMPETAARRTGWRAWVVGGALSLATLLLLWSLVRPGIVLRWKVVDGSLQAFRVYRAASGVDDFSLVEELPAQAEVDEYTFIDTRLLPGQEFTYMVEGLDQAGRPALSQMVTGNSLTLLPVQLALVFASLVLGYAVTLLTRRLPISGRLWLEL